MPESLTNQQRKQQKKRRFWIEIGVIAAVVLLLTLVMPAVLPAFRLKLLGRFLSLGIVAIAIDLIWGYTGLLSLGHGIFFTLGGYGLAMYLKLQLPEGEIPEFFNLFGVYDLPKLWEPFKSLPFTLGAIVVIPGIVAAFLGFLVFRNRIKGVYFSIITQAALLVFFNFFNGQQKLINGTNGLKTDTEQVFGFLSSGTDGPLLAGSDEAQLIFYECTIVFVLLAYLLGRWITSGRFGRLLIAIRDDENRVRFSGYDPTGFKVLIFALSGAIAGVSGALYTVQSGIITPSFMEVAFSIEMVIWVAVGGRGTLVGPIIGALLVNFGKSFLSELFPEIWLFFLGGLFLLVVTVLPSGIVGWFQEGGWSRILRLVGLEEPLSSYPAIESPEVQREREELSQVQSSPDP